MDHSQVAIQTDTTEKTYANIDILVEQEAAELTQPLSMAPVIILKWQKITQQIQYFCTDHLLLTRLFIH